MNSAIPNKGLEWTNFILGAALLGAAFLFAAIPVAAWNAAIVGAAIVSCSTAALYRHKAWAEWTNLGLGAWAVVAPFLLGFGSAQPATSVHVIIGLSVLSIACMQLVSGRAKTA